MTLKGPYKALMKSLVLIRTLYGAYKALKVLMRPLGLMRPLKALECLVRPFRALRAALKG